MVGQGATVQGGGIGQGTSCPAAGKTKTNNKSGNRYSRRFMMTSGVLIVFSERPFGFLLIRTPEAAV
jgi:hypothetical protein